MHLTRRQEELEYNFIIKFIARTIQIQQFVITNQVSKSLQLLFSNADRCSHLSASYQLNGNRVINVQRVCIRSVLICKQHIRNRLSHICAVFVTIFQYNVSILCLNNNNYHPTLPLCLSDIDQMDQSMLDSISMSFH